MQKIGNAFLTVLSLIIYGAQAIFTGLMAALVIIAAYLRLKTVMRFIVKIWGNAIFLLMGKWLHVYGKENFQKNHKYILLANHSSLYDIPAIMAIFSRVSWLGREHLARIPLFGYALKMIDYIPVSRHLTSGVRKIINDSIKNAGNITVAIFPEGTRSLDGIIHDFKRGFILILRSTGLDVVPVTLNGMYKLKPKPRFFINPFTKLEITIHEPIAYEELRDKDNAEILDQMQNIIRSAYKFS